MSHRMQLNLASEPFRRDRPMLVASAVVALLMVAVLGMLITLIVADREQSRDTRAEIERTTKRLAALTSEQNKLESILRQPNNAEVLERSVLLNMLLRRKGISWTLIFSDLERIMPHNVRLINVRPQVTSRNTVLLQMVVGAQSTGPVREMLVNMEKSPLFGPASMQNWVPPSQNDPLYRYRVSVNYARKL